MKMKRISELRRQKNLNQTGLAMQLNVSQKMISAYEHGINQPSIDALKKMSEIFNVSVDYIIENSDIKATADSLFPGSLSDDEIKLLNMFGGLSRKKQQMALGVMLTLAEIDC